MASAAGDEDGDLMRRRRRMILQNFYGSTEAEQEKQAAPDPSNIDNAAFDADRYFERLLRSQGVRRLLKTDQGMLRDIKKLDSDMKTLVYENYNKFICATDTIRDMKSNVENMEEEMQRLTTNMDTITVVSDRISATLAPRRDKLHELSGVYRLLKKRQFLFDLPRRLKRALEVGWYSQAVEHYKRTHGVLRKYSGIASFRAILHECDEIVAALRERLRLVLQSNENLAEVSEAAGLLIDLGEPIDDLCATFLSRMGQQLDHSLAHHEQLALDRRRRRKEELAAAAATSEKKAKEGEKGKNKKEEEKENENEEEKSSNPFDDDADLDKKEEDEQQKDEEDAEARKRERQAEAEEARQLEEVVDFVRQVDGSFLGLFLRVSDAYQGLFVHRPGTSPEHRAAALHLLDQHAVALFDRYAALLRAHLLESTEHVSHVVEGLRLMREDLLGLSEQLEELSLRHIASEVITHTVQKLIEQRFTSATSAIREAVLSVSKLAQEDAHDDEGRELQVAEAWGSITQAITGQLEDYFQHLKVLFVSTTSTDFLGQHSVQFFAKTVVNAQQLLLHVLVLMAPFHDDGASSAPPPAATTSGSGSSVIASHKRLPGVCTLELARVCVELEGWGLAHVQNIVQQLSALIAHHHADTPLAVGDLQKRFAHTSRLLLAHYVKCHGDKLSQMVRQAILTPNWLKAKLPRDVRPGMEMLVEEVRQMAREADLVFDQSAAPSDPATSASSSSSSSSSSGAADGKKATGLGRDGRARASRFEANIGRNLFEKKVQIFGAVSGDRDSIMLGILKICLKSLQECVRLKTFSRHGYQQLQLDLYFLAHALRPLAAPKDHPLFNRLLDDIQNSAGERCLDAQPAMELTVIENICQHKLRARDAGSVDDDGRLHSASS